MKLDKILVELNSRAGLKAWNQEEENIWLALVKDGLVDRNDVVKFKQFGKYFSDYFERFGETPPVEEMKKFIRTLDK